MAPIVSLASLPQDSSADFNNNIRSKSDGALGAAAGAADTDSFSSVSDIDDGDHHGVGSLCLANLVNTLYTKLVVRLPEPTDPPLSSNGEESFCLANLVNKLYKKLVAREVKPLEPQQQTPEEEEGSDEDSLCLVNLAKKLYKKLTAGPPDTPEHRASTIELLCAPEPHEQPEHQERKRERNSEVNNNDAAEEELTTDSLNLEATITANPVEEVIESQILLSDDNETTHTHITIRAPVSPFFLREQYTACLVIKVAVGTIVLFPIRSVLTFATLSTSWCLAFIGTLGKSGEALQNEPLSAWRRAIRWIVGRVMMRIYFFFAGFYWVRIRGERATPQEAPILVAAPHSSYFDALVLVMTGVPGVVARAETLNEWFSGTLVNLLQPVYVHRDNLQSRSAAIRAIADRAAKISAPDSLWPQLFMYPEGTCGNRSCILKFKVGAFIPGVPVQPVLIRFPNHMDYISWTFGGPGVIKTVWLTLTKWWNNCTIEYLPVYHPSEEEKKNPVLYANNVRAFMARELGVPTSEYTNEDGVAIDKLDAGRGRLSDKLTVVSSFRDYFSVAPLLEINMMQDLSSNARAENMVTKESLAHHLLISHPNYGRFHDLLEALGQKHHLIDMRGYLVYACLLNPATRVEHLIPPFFAMYANRRRRMTFQEFKTFMTQTFLMSQEAAERAYTAGRAGEPEESIDRDTFSTKVKYRLEYLKLLALEASGKLTEYPPWDHPLNNSGRPHAD